MLKSFDRTDGLTDDIIINEISQVILKDRERIILDMRYRDYMTYAAIGNALGISRDRVGQIIRNYILRKLRGPLKDKGLIVWKKW